jgi:Carbohydrate esterase, sialic acid-specific acetylesterase
MSRSTKPDDVKASRKPLPDRTRVKSLETISLTDHKTPFPAPSVPRLPPLIRALRGDRLIWSYIRQRLSFEIQRPFKRALFWFTSGGKDLDLIDPFHFSFRNTAGRRAVSNALYSDGSTSAVILGLGQSNIANECDPSALYEAKGKVYNFNFFDGKCYLARDPLLGASHDRSNVLTRVGDLLVERGSYESVILVPIAHGGTFASEWSPTGRMFPRLQWTLERLRERQIKITHIAWQQGEADSADRNPNPEEWMTHFIAMVDAIRAAGAEAPIYVAQCTICSNDPNEKIRAAQRRVVNPALGIFPGPDIDLIGRDERYDGCHLSATGLRHAAELWYETLRRTT